MSRGKKSFFRSGNVKSNYAVVAVPNGKFGYLKATISMAHGRNQLACADESAAITNLLHRPL